MKRLRIDLGDRSYDILIGRGLLPRLVEFLPERPRRAVIVTNPEINRLYGGPVRQSLESTGIEWGCVEIPEGEAHKTLEDANRVYDYLLEGQYDRKTLLIALGGGVIGDLTGFVAATYQRGVPYVQVPTTLLSQVDSSVGGKTAVNHPAGKNMIGAFYQPRAVVADLDTLNSLSPDEFRCGLAEIIKYGVIEDPELFAYLEDHVDDIQKLETKCLAHIIQKSCAIKARVVEKDEHESNYRMVLNFGHTLGHAVEALTHYSQFKHGEAVAIGMVFAAQLSQHMGLCNAAIQDRIARLISLFGLPTRLPPFESADYIASMHRDKKAHGNHIRFIVVRQIGKIEIADSVEESVLSEVIGQMELSR